LLINAAELVQRAEIIREKGTNRSQFFRGQVDKYTWCDLGSSFLPGELIAAFLWAQMEAGEDINSRRITLWDRYNSAFDVFERDGKLRRPIVPDMCIHNAHMYYVLLPSLDKRAAFISYLKSQGIGSVFHYVPLHSAPAARDFSRYHGGMDITDQYSDRLVRLPLWVGLDAEIDEVIGKVSDAIAHIDDNF